ncbi:MAG: YqgE/AlgH family protein [Pseudohongiellaceae bacterium]
MSSSIPQTNLENQFLIAMPQMQDSFFSGTVTYLWKHSKDGALGIVLNKPLAATVSDILEELNINCDKELDSIDQQKVVAGGPVERDKGFILHNSDRAWDSSIKTGPGISLCTSRTILQDIAIGQGPEKYLIALGCAGWDGGQLEKEIADNAWLNVPVQDTLLFSRDYETMASSAAALLGIAFNQISPQAGHS